MKFKPMLAEDANLDFLKFPLFASPKLDGVRATFVDGKLLTRNLKPLGNRALQNWTHDQMLDGELVVGDPRSSSAFRDTMKVVSAHEADITDVRYFVFDIVSTEDFASRLRIAHQLIEGSKRYVPVPHTPVYGMDQLLKLEEVMVGEGYEGLMLRDPSGRYKFGRATTREGLLLKLKRRLQSEARVVEFEEQMHNANEAKINALGYMERSSHQANKVPMGVLGALVVEDIKSKIQFNVGTGFTYEDREEIWKNRETYRGKMLTYEYLPVGVKDKPRHPIFVGWRLDR